MPFSKCSRDTGEGAGLQQAGNQCSFPRSVHLFETISSKLVETSRLLPCEGRAHAAAGEHVCQVQSCPDCTGYDLTRPVALLHT